MKLPTSYKRFHTFAIIILSIAAFSTSNFSQKQDSFDTGEAVYKKLKAFSLSNGKAEVNNLILKRDRVVMTFSGTFYFAEKVKNRVTGAVFIGQGNLKADVPQNDFEKTNIKRLLGTESINANFKKAVLRFTDNTFSVIGKNAANGSGDTKAQKMAKLCDGQKTPFEIKLPLKPVKVEFDSHNWVLSSKTSVK